VRAHQQHCGHTGLALNDCGIEEARTRSGRFSCYHSSCDDALLFRRQIVVALLRWIFVGPRKSGGDGECSKRQRKQRSTQRRFPRCINPAAARRAVSQRGGSASDQGTRIHLSKAQVGPRSDQLSTCAATSSSMPRSKVKLGRSSGKGLQHARTTAASGSGQLTSENGWYVAMA